MKKSWLNLIADPADGNGNDTALLDKIERGIGEIKTQHKSMAEKQAEILTNLDRADKEVQKSMEELTKVKGNINEFSVALEKLQRAIALNARASFADPVQAFCADEQKRNWLNAVARKLCFPSAKLPAHLEKALTGVDSGLGQAVIPTEYMSEIYHVLSEYGAYNTLRVRPLGARATQMPLMTGRPTFYWIGAGTGGSAETTAGTEGNFSGGSVSGAVQTGMVLVYASREELQDATTDMSAEILRGIAESIAYGLDFSAFASNGGADQTDAGYYGIFETATVHTGCIATAAAGNVTVGTTDLDDWVRCQTTVSAAVNKRASKWWMNPTILAMVALIRDSNGRPIFQTALEAPSTTIGSILGKPIVPVDAAPSTNAASAKIAVYGDADSYVVGIRQDIELAQSEHIKFAENMIGFRGTIRASLKHRIPTGNPAGHKPLVVLTLPGA